MQCKFTFKHLAPLESISEYAETRINKIEKFNLHKEMKCQFIFSVQKDAQVAEILADNGGRHFTATATDASLYVAIDLAVDKLERQLLKVKEKIQNHHNFEESNEGYLRQEIAAQAADLHHDEKPGLQTASKKT